MMRCQYRDNASKDILAVLMALLMIATPLSALFVSSGPVAADRGTDDLDMEPRPLDYGNRVRDLTFLLHSINASETSKVVAGHTTDLYMDTTLDFNDTSYVREITGDTTYTWYLSPVLAANLTAGHFDFKIWCWGNNDKGTPKGSIDVDVYEVNTTSWAYVAGSGTGDVSFQKTAELKVISNDFTNHTFRAGSSVVVNMTMSLGAADSLGFAFDTARANSRFSLSTSDGATLDEIYTEDHTGTRKRSFNPTLANKTINLTAEVTDPLGGYDVRWVNVTMETRGQIILNNVTMTRTAGSDTGSASIYKRSWNYSGYQNGRYNYTIWITDNSGHNHYYHLQMYVWDNYTSEASDFFTIGNMVFANVKVVDSKNVTLVGAEIKLKVGGGGPVMGIGTTNSTGMHNFTTVFTGTYDVLVIWQDVVVANVSSNINDNITHGSPLLIKANVFYPTFKVVDSRGTKLAGASVFLGFPNGTVAANPWKTNSSGEFDLTQMANGTYALTVLWMDVEVNDTTVDVTSNATLKIYTEVYYLSTLVVDSRDSPLAGAQVVMANSTTGIVRDSKITNLSGGYEFRLPAGDYDISVFWQNTLIYTNTSFGHYSNTLLKIDGDIFYLVVRVVDTHDVPVESAQVVVSATEGNVLDSNFTDENGRIDSRLPVGTHTVGVYWQGVLVNSSQVTFSDDAEVTVVASIYYPNFTFVDADGKAVGNARVDFLLNGTDEILASLTSDENGHVDVRLPAAQYDVEVYWKDVKVLERYDETIAEDLDVEWEVSVYHLEVLCLDSRDVPLKDASVTFYLNPDQRLMASSSTDGNGTVFIRLPGAAYDVEVMWGNTLVAQEVAFLLQASGIHTIHTDVFYLEGTALDSRGVEIPSTTVEVRDDNGITVTTLLADETGKFTIRLPVGNYDIDILWKGIIVNTTLDLAITSDEAIDFLCSVYYLELSPVDSRDIYINGALITVTSLSTGKIVASATSATTGSTDPVVLRLPGTSYNLTVTWKGVVINTTAELVLSSDAEIFMECSVGYLTVMVMDANGVIVEGAGIALFHVTENFNRSSMTGSTGVAVFRIPAGEYDVTVEWRDVRVHSEEARAFRTDDTWELEVAIYYPEMLLQDSRDAPVGGAHLDVYVESTGVLMASGQVSDEGNLVMRLPATSYRVICSWLGHQVLDTTIDVDSSTGIELDLRVYYYEAQVVDSMDRPVMDAVVHLIENGTDAVLGSDITDQDGRMGVRLPTGTFDLSVVWLTVQVQEREGLQLEDDINETLEVRVHQLTLRMVDDRDVPVFGALAGVTHQDEEFASVQSNEDGTAQLRLPAATYDVSISWMDVDVGHVSSLVLDRDMEEEVSLDIHYLTVGVKDGNGEKLKGAMVTVLIPGEELVEAGQTAKNGTAEFRLPAGSYTIKVHYSSTYLMTGYSSTQKKDVQLDASEKMKFTFADYPPPIYTTNTFLVGLLSAVLLVVIVLATMKLLQPFSRD